MRFLPLNHNRLAIVDDEDLEDLLKYRWRSIGWDNSGRWYAINHTGKTLHRYLLQAPVGLQVDHIGGKGGLDCRRVNLRLCTRQENGAFKKEQTAKRRRRTEELGVAFTPEEASALNALALRCEMDVEDLVRVLCDDAIRRQPK